MKIKEDDVRIFMKRDASCILAFLLLMEKCGHTHLVAMKGDKVEKPLSLEKLIEWAMER